MFERHRGPWSKGLSIRSLHYFMAFATLVLSVLLLFLPCGQLTVGFAHRQIPPFFSVGSNIKTDKLYYSLTNRRNTGCLAEPFFAEMKKISKIFLKGGFGCEQRSQKV